MPLTAPSIEIAGVTKTFGDKTAVDDVSFSAPPGELTYLLGPNGAGKSTLIRMIAGYAAPDAGTIAVNGGRLRDFAEVRREIGFGLNPFARDPKLSARRHLRWQARLAGLPRGEADRVLELVGLADVAGKLVGGFSFGMLQRLNIATALLGDPRTIVLDEPTNGLDVDGTLWLRELLTDYAADGRCLLVASHSLSEVAITADRVVVMGRGRVLTDATRDEVLALGSGPRPLEAAYLALTRESIDYRGNEVAR